MQLHLVDATFELFRAFYALPLEHGPSGEPINAIRGLLSSMLALLREPGVTHVGCATDTVIESFRNQLYPGYKTGEGIDPNLWAQFPLAEEAMEAIGLTVWKMVEFEADDALATAAHRFADAVERVVILSPDKDLAQCVRGTQVVTLDRIRGALYDEAAVHVKFGVGPTSIADWLALVGDSADGFPGLPGWGKKTASTILAVYEHIERIPDDVTQWTVPLRGAARLAETLATHRATAMLFKQLATLRTDAPITRDLDDLRWRGIPQERFLDFCERHGLRGLAARAGVAT